MSQVLVTVDTELSVSRHAAGMPLAFNLDQSIDGRVGERTFGIEWQMACMEARGITGVFFVDPMPALIYGSDWLARVVEQILRRGHEIQLHIHTEWLQWSDESPVEGRQGRDIGDFSLADQVALIGWVRDTLEAAGAPQPCAFRAGNYGANDDTLRALAQLGLQWDASFNPDYSDRGCRIDLACDAVDPTPRYGVIELPVAGIWDIPGHFRPAQVCSLSAREMRLALAHAAATGAPAFAAVTHSFEMLSRDRARPNKAVMSRFEALCEAIARQPRHHSVGFADLDPALSNVPRNNASRLPPDRLRTWARMAEQALANWRFERQLRPT